MASLEPSAGPAWERRGPPYSHASPPAPPGIPPQMLWLVWILREVGLPVVLLGWFVLRADAALAEIAAGQRLMSEVLALLVEAVGR